MVLDALGIGAGDVLADSDRLQEGDHDLVPPPGCLGDAPPLLGEEDRAIGLGGDQPALLQARDGLGDAGMGHTQPARDIGRARFAGRVDQVGDQFDIVLRDLGLPREPGLAVMPGLLVGLDEHRPPTVAGLLRVSFATRSPAFQRRSDYAGAGAA